MRIAFYCQHVLGVGHFHRSLEICQKLAKHHTVTMITGGAPVENRPDTPDFFHLPGLKMDSQFNNLAPCDPGFSLTQVKDKRKTELYNFIRDFAPQVFLVELYPFGRKAFRFELDPVLKDIKSGKLVRSLCLCSVRDILVERHDREKFEERIVTTLNSFFDGVLVHGDSNFITLDQTFSRVADIAIPIGYTGYISPPVDRKDPLQIRRELQIDDGARLVVASIGGGGVGSELLLALAQAFPALPDPSLRLQMFTGPYAEESVFRQLANIDDPRVKVERFTSRFTDWLAAADLSVSMAGYNTTMNILAAGLPALFFPFAHNHEQYMRISRLEGLAPLRIIEKHELNPDRLGNLIMSHLSETRYNSPISLDGAQNSVTLIEKWHQNFGK